MPGWPRREATAGAEKASIAVSVRGPRRAEAVLPWVAGRREVRALWTELASHAPVPGNTICGSVIKRPPGAKEPCLAFSIRLNVPYTGTECPAVARQALGVRLKPSLVAVRSLRAGELERLRGTSFAVVTSGAGERLERHGGDLAVVPAGARQARTFVPSELRLIRSCWAWVRENRAVAASETLRASVAADDVRSVS